jgi:hypothetical protein
MVSNHYGAVENKTNGSEAVDETIPLKSTASGPTMAPLNRKILRKTVISFYVDALSFTPGTVPHSIVLAIVVGVVSFVDDGSLVWSDLIDLDSICWLVLNFHSVYR